MTLQEEMRSAARDLRVSSMPLSVLIPLLQKAADRIDQDEKDIAQLQMDASFTKAEQFCAGVFNKN